MPCHDLLAQTLQLAAVADVIRGAIMVLFIVVSFLVILVVLAQEGKGGGLAGAFGGAGADAFGVKAGTVNKFTAWLAGLFLGLALLHAGLSSEGSGPVSDGPDTSEYESGEENPGSGDPAKGDGEEKKSD
ncbi:MAG: preprotein translocase subunit SecG [Planctomycetota bacterium]|nr:preprotein translocase subunit SecG [Planctomycetota bacterium]